VATTTSEVVAALVSRVREAMQVAFLSTFLAVKPVPASRPRVTRWGGVYYGKAYAEFLSETQAELAKLRGCKVEGYVVLLMEVICEKPRTGKLELPRGDVDNHGKGPMDAATKAATVWSDDDKVAFVAIAKRYARPGETQGVRFEFAPLT
jgi:Holliday junction resolvase RusA-like endonuclease